MSEDLFAVTALYAGERFYFWPVRSGGGFEGFEMQTAPFSTPFGPILRDAYFQAIDNPDLDDVQIVRMD